MADKKVGGRRDADTTRNAGSGECRRERSLGDAGRCRRRCCRRHPSRFRCPARRLRLPRPRVWRPDEVSICGKAHLHAAAGFRRAVARAPARAAPRSRRGGAAERLRRRQRLHARRRTPPGGARAWRCGHRQDHIAHGARGDGGRGNSWRAAQSRNQHGGSVRSSRCQSRPRRDRRANPRAGLACADLHSHCRDRGAEGSPRADAVPGGGRPFRPRQSGTRPGPTGFRRAARPGEIRRCVCEDLRRLSRLRAGAGFCGCDGVGAGAGRGQSEQVTAFNTFAALETELRHLRFDVFADIRKMLVGDDSNDVRLERVRSLHDSRRPGRGRSRPAQQLRADEQGRHRLREGRPRGLRTLHGAVRRAPGMAAAAAAGFS